MLITIDDLRQKILLKLTNNFSNEQAEKISEYLLWADMSGITTQGVIKMTGTEPIQNIVPEHDMKVLRDTKLSQLIDAGANPAPLVSQVATDIAIEKARNHGIGIVGVRNTHSSNGAQSFYVEKIAQNNFVGVMCSRSPAAVTGFGSIDPLFGTNPIGFAFPTQESPFVFDTATSAMTFYGLVLAKAKGESISENMAIDKDGNMTTDPESAMGGALLSFDRTYKGSGFGMVVEMLAGPLIGGAFVDNQTFKEEWGTFILAIDPELFVDIDKFKLSSSELIQRIKQSRRADSVRDIRLPGERTRELYQQALSSGKVDIDENILKQLLI